jgi:serine/threonine protein kinase
VKTCSQCQLKYPDRLEFCPRDGTRLPTGAEQAISATVEDDPMIGATIDGRYTIEARLGEGGMGVVYKARHAIIDKLVAIKILRKEASQDEASVKRFLQEARSASKIGHSNIVDITDYGEIVEGKAYGHAYFVMEFLQGPTLAEALQEGPLQPLRVCNIAMQMARGLYAAHQKGIVHRDLKPENIFLLDREGKQDFVKIVDFGIAKVGTGPRLTQVGMVLGTPEYMSPEQATGSDADHRVDQYALGCMMYEMLTGTVPFLGDRPAQTLTKHVFEQAVPPRQRTPDLNIPASLEAVVMRTLEKKPDRRFPSMRELEQALQGVEAELRSGRVVVDESRVYGSSREQVTMPPDGSVTGNPSAGSGVPAYPQPPYPSSPVMPTAPPVGHQGMSGAPPYLPNAGSQPYGGPGPGPGIVQQPYNSMASGAVPMAYVSAPPAPAVYPMGPMGTPMGGPATYPSGVMYPPGPGVSAPNMPAYRPGEGRASAQRVRMVMASILGVMLAIIGVLIYVLFIDRPPPRPIQVPPGPSLSGVPGSDASRPPVVTPGLGPGPGPAIGPGPGPGPKPPQPVEPEVVRVHIDARPVKAEVFVDGVSRGMTPYDLEQPRGQAFRLRLHRRGFQTHEKQYEALRPDTIVVTLRKGGGRPTKETPPPQVQQKQNGLRNPFGQK